MPRLRRTAIIAALPVYLVLVFSVECWHGLLLAIDMTTMKGQRLFWRHWLGTKD